MEKSEAVTLLHQLILLKEEEHKIEAKLLKEHFHVTYESLKPAAIIKNLFNDITSDPGIKAGALNTAIGLAVGFIAKKVVTPKTNNPFTNLFGNAVEMIVANKVTKNADGIKSIAGILLDKILNQTKVK